MKSIRKVLKEIQKLEKEKGIKVSMVTSIHLVKMQKNTMSRSVASTDYCRQTKSRLLGHSPKTYENSRNLFYFWNMYCRQ